VPGLVSALGVPLITQAVEDIERPAERAGLTVHEVIAPPEFEGVPVVEELMRSNA
jgi:hypothetical protein